MTAGRATTSRHFLLFWLLIFLAPALWILFVGTFNPHELLVGAFASALTVVFIWFVGRSTDINLTLRPGDLIRCWRLPWYILSGTYEIVLVLGKDLFGIARAKSLYRVCGFDSSVHDPLRAARMAMAIVYTTTAPNFIAIGIDPSQSRMLFHQLERSSVPKMTKALGAKG